jgi:hypothetical protein
MTLWFEKHFFAEGQTESNPTDSKPPFEPIAIGTPVQREGGGEGVAIGNDKANGVIRVFDAFSGELVWHKRSEITPGNSGHLMPVYVINQPEPTTLDRQEADSRLRRNIQWGIVRGMFLYSLFMIPIAFIAALIITAMR